MTSLLASIVNASHTTVENLPNRMKILPNRMKSLLDLMKSLLDLMKSLLDLMAAITGPTLHSNLSQLMIVYQT